jgi:hypothetical protein
MGKHILAVIFIILCLSACQTNNTVCPPVTGTPESLSLPPDQLPTPTPGPGGTMEVVINGRSMTVDKVVEGPLCNDTWSGVVYVGCNVQVFDWVDQPLFLKDCNLMIEPGTVVYVAYHNNSAYYNGCSCHISGTAEPNPK